MSLRVLIYDGTSKPGERALRSAWAAGARVYASLGRVDGFHGSVSWADALEWLARYRPNDPIAEIQFWGHGHWGEVLIAEDRLNERAFDAKNGLRPLVDAVRPRLLPDGGSLVWFRTCETFGARRGQAFAIRASSELGARVAGHTYIIGALQSGLHGLRPGEAPRWSAEEGLADGTSDAPISARWSSRNAPHTIHFMNARFDASWFDS